MLNNLPTLQGISQKLESDISRIDADMKGVKSNERYATNESERQYRLDKLAEEREKTLIDAEERYQTELQAVELSLAEQAFSAMEATDAELEQAQQTLAAIKTQSLTTGDPVGTASLLAIKAELMTDAEKVLLSSNMAEIEESLATKVTGRSMSDFTEQMNAVKQAARNTKQAKSVAEQMDALQQVKRGASSVRRKYDARDKALNRKQGGNVTPFDKDFYEKHIKRSAK